MPDEERHVLKSLKYHAGYPVIQAETLEVELVLFLFKISIRRRGSRWGLSEVLVQAE